MEISIEDLFDVLNILVKPADKESTGELHDILELNLNNALKKLKVEKIHHLDTLQAVKCCVTPQSSVRWKFVCVLLHILLTLKTKLAKAGQPKNNEGAQKAPAGLLSINQQKLIRTCLQFIVSIGLLPSLLPGVGVSLAARCSNSQHLKEEDLVVVETQSVSCAPQKYERLAGVIRALIACCEHQALRSLVLSNHLGDLMAALAQLSFVPLAKPVTDASSCAQKAVAEGDVIMTQELWDKLQSDRKQFQKCFLSFVAQVYQPLIIRELLLLQGSPDLVGTSRVAPPAWLKRVCIQQLIHCLTRPGGVSSLMRVICDLTPDNWNKLDTAARLITHVHTTNADQYYSNICGQLVKILMTCDKDRTKLYLMVTILCVKALSEKKPDICKRYVMDVIMKSLMQCCEGYDSATCTEEVDLSQNVEATKLESSSKQPVKIVVTEADLAQCIETLHKCFFQSGADFTGLPTDHIATILSPLFYLHVKVRRSASHLKNQVQELILKFLLDCSPQTLNDALCLLLLNKNVDSMLRMSNKYEFVFGPSGGIQVQMKENPNSISLEEDFADCLLELVEEDRSGELSNKLFIFLLQVLAHNKDRTADVQRPEDCDEIQDSVTVGGEQCLTVVRLLALLAETSAVQESIGKDPTHVIHFIKYMLEKDAILLANGGLEENEKYLDLENLFLVLMVLSVVISEPSSRSEVWDQFQDLVDPLKIIYQNVSHIEVKLFANRLYNAIITRGVAREATVSKPSGKSKEKTTRSKNKKKGPEKTAAARCAKNGEKPSQLLQQEKQEQEKKTEDVVKSRLRKALCEAHENMVPERGHGLIELTRLVSQGDKEALQIKDEILNIFKENLEHEDSYIYLQAVNGLVALADRYFENVVKILLELYTDMRTRSGTEEELATLKLKAGEALVRVVRAMEHNYSTLKAPLLNAFLHGTKDPDYLVRASSLSNLGEICKTLSFRIGPIMFEILTCVQSILQSDPSVEVRRAAVLVIKLIIEGAEKDKLQTISEVVLEVYRTLKKVHSKETDGVLKMHAEQALVELRNCALDLIFPQPKLEKKLYVLDPPPGS